ncbi:MAG TPA: enoyl-CoA hydratase [Acidimicrobiales bacterium]|nr:enoyl-CoA hydratase [Acidimicrobiales bacterium]
MADEVRVEVVERVATITLNRPEVRNALNAPLLDALHAAVVDLEGDDGVDVLVLTGADPAFCAGVDLKALGSGGLGQRHVGDARNPLAGRTKPLIGAVNGPTVTGGLEIALNCDFLIASERARFADTHARVGIQPGWGLTVLLPQAIGVRRARQMSITGNYVDASTALAWGLVNQVVAHDQLLPACRALAADIVSNDQAALRRILATYAEGALTTASEAWDLEARVSRTWADSHDVAEVEARRAAIVERGRSQQGAPRGS